MKHFIFALFLILFGTHANAADVHTAPIVNVKYIHDYILYKWNIRVPYNDALTNDRQAANMKYLLTAIDVANRILNGTDTTDYGTSEYATAQAANTSVTIQAVDRLIRQEFDSVFTFVPLIQSNNQTFRFYLNAGGTFNIDWGDGTIENHVLSATDSNRTISHTYKSSATYTVQLTGRAAEYPNSVDVAAIAFSANLGEIESIDGCLGCIFGTLSDGTQPRFYKTFISQTALKSAIPQHLFSGINGAPTEDMFAYTFYGCSNLSGAIPPGLFAGINGKPADEMFYGTFTSCTSLSGSIPDNLFTGIKGSPAYRMFRSTFHRCTGLSDDIPSGLFAGISGQPADEMFYQTFYGCENLTGIGDNLFGNIAGNSASNMFYRTFYGCTALNGMSATVGTGTDKEYLYERWSGGSYSENAYYNDKNLTDYNRIPAAWK